MTGAEAKRVFKASWAAATAVAAFGIAAIASATAATAATTTNAAAATAAAPSALPPLVSGPPADSKIGPGWRVVALPNQKLPVTNYAAERLDERPALRIEAKASYGNLVHDVASVRAPRSVSWAWRVQQPNPQTVLTDKAGDDQAAKVCLSFDLPLNQVPFVERQLMRLARSRSGEDLPAATLCWVWGGAEAREQRVDNPYTRRVRYIVLRNQADAVNTWFEETRDVAADFKRAFGDESAELPPVVAVVVAGDADNTRAHSIAYVAALRWLP
jgi:hypothetical protein